MEMLVVCILFFLLAVLSILLMNSEKLEKIFPRHPKREVTTKYLSELASDVFAEEYQKYRVEAIRRGQK